MKPCQHSSRADKCRICELYETNEKYRAMWDATGPDLPRTLPDIRPCVHLGKRLEGQPCGSPLLQCDLFGDVTTRFSPCAEAQRCCDGCEHKVFRLPFAPKPNDPRVGVAIGSFRWPELVDLQCRAIRATCGPVPILVSNDDPSGHETLTGICQAFDDVTLDTNPERIGHTGGDIAVFSKAIAWGEGRGLEAVAKLSQRFVIDRARWLQDSAAELLASGLPMASRRCRGVAPFDLRTEAVLLDVAQWNRPDALERIKPRKYWNDEAAGLCAETIIFRVLTDLLGGVFWPWASLMGEDRFRRDSPDVFWHCNTKASDYKKLAADYGVKISDGFHVDGWQNELKAGTYLYG